MVPYLMQQCNNNRKCIKISAENIQLCVISLEKNKSGTFFAIMQYLFIQNSQ
jgi:hypothetical protein